MGIYEIYLAKALGNLTSARQSLITCKETNQKVMKNIAAYNTQQAIEFILKYLIYNSYQYNGGNSNIKELRTHNLDMLIRVYCKQLGIQVPKYIADNAIKYTSWEAESRYSLHMTIRVDSIKSAIVETENWLVSIKPFFKRKLAFVRNKYRI